MRRPAPWLLTSLLLASCSGPPTYQVETVDGVRHVHNLAPHWGDQPQLSLEHVLTIGAEETEDERYLLDTPSDAIMDEEGTIFVMDRWRPGIRAYDLEGRHLLDISGRGTGPGELVEALCMDRDGAGDFYVSDPPGGKVTVLGSDGSFRRIFRPDRFFFQFRVLSGGNIAAPFADPAQEEIPVLHLFDAEGRKLWSAGRGETHEQDTVRSQYNAAAIEVGEDDTIYLSFSFQNRIEIYSREGELRTRIDRPLAYPIEVDVEFREYQNDGEAVVYPMPVLTFVSRGIGIDDRERIWVLTYASQPDATEEDPNSAFEPAVLRFEVYDREGILLGYVPLPVLATGFRICGDYLLLADPLELGCVYVYRIVADGGQ